MKKTEKNLRLLFMLFGVALIMANVIGSKIWDTGIPLFGTTITITTGAICYPITFLVTDIIGELWGKEEAGQAVKFGFVCQLVALAIILIAQVLTPVDSNMQNAYNTLLGQSVWFVTGSLTAFVCSQNCDVFLFHKIRDYYKKKHNGSIQGGKWIWNNASTMTSQLVDTVVMVLIAFGIGFGWLFDPNMHIVLITMIIGQYLCKFVLAALDTPFFYLLTKNSK